MNLNKLFPIQAELDHRIVKKFGLEGQDLLPKKVLSLQVELAELANEARFFKFWSEDQEPRGYGNYLVYACCEWGKNRWEEKNPLLEEYVDGLHFVLSIGNDHNYHDIGKYIAINPSICGTFTTLMRMRWEAVDSYKFGLKYFLDLGEMLGFTEDEIEKAYLDKNKVNYARLESGY